MKYSGFLFAFTLLLTVAACGGDDDTSEPNCSTDNITYTNTVADIFNDNCATSGCHVSGAPQGGLSSYDEASNFTFENLMISALRRDGNASEMPKNGDKLDDCTIDKIEAWLGAGKPE